MTTLTADRARLFHSLHDPAHPLVLANAWDVASAAVIAAAGAPAIATTSAGVAWSLGVADGDQLGCGVAVEAIARIAGAVNVPVTADIEGGYGQTGDEVAATIERLLAHGVVGVNVEDGAREPADVADRIAAARQAADRAGVSLFINARTDVFLRGIGPAADRLAETFDRARTYLAAGADGIFVPGVVDPETIGALTGRIPAPVNIMAGPGAPSLVDHSTVLTRSMTGSRRTVKP